MGSIRLITWLLPSVAVALLVGCGAAEARTDGELPTNARGGNRRGRCRKRGRADVRRMDAPRPRSSYSPAEQGDSHQERQISWLAIKRTAAAPKASA
jgi:hypothetical protein